MKLVKLDDVLELIDGSMADLESNYENSKLQEEIKRLPTVDVEPVKHGHWENYLAEGLRWKCSVCGSRFETPYHYCPHCGKEMKEVEG